MPFRLTETILANIFEIAKLGLLHICNSFSIFISDKEKGVATFFLLGCYRVPEGMGWLPGKFGFCGAARGTRAVRTKTQLAHHQTKKMGYTKMC